MPGKLEHKIRIDIKRIVSLNRFPLIIHTKIYPRLKEVIGVYSLTGEDLKPFDKIKEGKDMYNIYALPLNQNVYMLLHYVYRYSSEPGKLINDLVIELGIPFIERTRLRKGLRYRWIPKFEPIYRLLIHIPSDSMLDPEFVYHLGIDIAKEFARRYPNLVASVVTKDRTLVSAKDIEKLIKEFDEVAKMVLARKRNVLAKAIASKGEYIRVEMANPENVENMLREFSRNWQRYIEEVSSSKKS